MPRTERTRSVKIELDGVVGLGELEEAALAFARSAPAELVADTIESMIAEVVERQLDAPGRAPVAGAGEGSVAGASGPSPASSSPPAATVSFCSQ